MTRIKVAMSSFVFLTMCTVAVAWSEDRVSRQQGEQNEATVLRYLRPILQSSGATARIYYRADCQSDPDYPIPFPRLTLRQPRARYRNASVVGDVFRNNAAIAVTRTERGLFHIRIGKVPEELLQTKISNVSFKTSEQYDIHSAFRVIENTVEFRRKQRQLRVRAISRPYDLPVQAPMEGLPHLPPSLKKVTVDQALDEIAKTFGVVIVFGYCSSPPTYDLTYTGIKEW